jgi:hypothetical protein
MIRPGENAMALADDVLESGNIFSGLVIGAAALIVWPLTRPLVRSLAKTAIKGGILTYREATRLYDGTVRGIDDLAKEAIEEIGTNLTKEAIEEVGTDLAEDVEDIGADLVKEAL